MNPNRYTQLACVLVMVGCVLGASVLTPVIDRQRLDLQLNFQITADKGQEMPPHVAMAVTCLGAFRGLIVNILWIRIESMKQQGKYYEADTLANWITTLQPRFGQVWLFQSWNEAYNISVGTQTPQERWEWVSKGVRLLRDKGIPYNETNIALYAQLGQNFIHKIGGKTDDAHWYYKSKLAEEWSILLGNEVEGATPTQVLENFRKVADAPESVKLLVQTEPDVLKLIDKLEEIGLEPDSELVRQYGTVQVYALPQHLPMLPPDKQEDLLTRLNVKRELMDLMESAVDQPRFDKLIATLRKREIIDVFHMDPQYMMDIMDGKALAGHFVASKLVKDSAGNEVEQPPEVDIKAIPAPLDWRHPAAHSAYWALLGTDKAIYRFSKQNVDQLNTYRTFIHSMQALMYSGNVRFNPHEEIVEARIMMNPNIAFFDVYDEAYTAGVAFVKTHKFSSGTADSFDMGHMNFLEKAVVFSYLYGDEAKARYYYNKVKDLYGDRGEVGGRYNLTLERFVWGEIPETHGEFVGRQQLIDAMFTLAFHRGLRNSDKETYNKYRKRAAFAFQAMSDKTFTPNVAERDRLGVIYGEKGRLKSFEDAEAAHFLKYLTTRQYYLGDRSRAFINAPNKIKLPIYDLAAMPLGAECKSLGMVFKDRFPEPAGIDEFRKAHPMPGEKEDEDNRGKRIAS